MSDDHQLGFLLLDQLGDGVGAGLQEVRLLLRLHLLALGLGLSDLLQALTLGERRLRTVLVQQLEQLHGGLLVQRLRELVHWRRHLQTLLEDGLLALHTDVLRPAHEAGQVALRLDVLACAGERAKN